MDVDESGEDTIGGFRLRGRVAAAAGRAAPPLQAAVTPPAAGSVEGAQAPTPVPVQPGQPRHHQEVEGQVCGGVPVPHASDASQVNLVAALPAPSALGACSIKAPFGRAPRVRPQVGTPAPVAERASLVVGGQGVPGDTPPSAGVVLTSDTPRGAQLQATDAQRGDVGVRVALALGDTGLSASPAVPHSVVSSAFVSRVSGSEVASLEMGEAGEAAASVLSETVAPRRRCDTPGVRAALLRVVEEAARAPPSSRGPEAAPRVSVLATRRPFGVLVESVAKSRGLPEAAQGPSPSRVPTPAAPPLGAVGAAAVGPAPGASRGRKHAASPSDDDPDFDPACGRRGRGGRAVSRAHKRSASPLSGGSRGSEGVLDGVGGVGHKKLRVEIGGDARRGGPGALPRRNPLRGCRRTPMSGVVVEHESGTQETGGGEQ